MANVADILGEMVESDRILSPKSLNLPDYLSPEVVIYPTTEAELSAVMACACKHRWRVIPCGSGSKLSWGGIGAGVDLMVSTARLNQVIDHAVGDMTLTAQAGAKLSDLAPRLAQHNQFLAIDPAYPDHATLGGIVATADTGSLRQRYGGLRDMLIGISFVRYDGQVAKAGGRVVKNVAGYDLMKLLTGSYGTLGVIAQLTFRLYPVQESSKTVVATGTADAVASLAAKLRQSPLTPVGFDLLSPALAHHLGYGDKVALLVRFQSIAPGVDEQLQALLAMLGANVTCQVLAGEADQKIWAAVRHALFAKPDSTSRAVLAKVALHPHRAVALLQRLPAGSWARMHAGSGIGTVRWAEGTAAEIEKLRFAIGELSRANANTTSGYLTLLEAPRVLKQSVDVWGYSGNALGLMKALKAQFDPHGTLSPGRFVGGI